MEQQIQNLRERASEEIQAATTLKALDDVQIGRAHV